MVPSPPTHNDIHRRLEGLLLGTAVADAIGLPRESLSPRRANALFGPPPFEHRFLFRGGMFSDDTEHACMTAEALIRSRGNIEHFRRSLASSLRWWLLLIPAGVGLATLRSCIKLWCGISPAKSGVRSAGNGPAMRAAIIGAMCHADPPRLRDTIAASTHLTHRDPKALQGALAIALAAACIVSNDTFSRTACTESILAGIDDPELRNLIQSAAQAAQQNHDGPAFCASLNLKTGVSGYIYHTVPVALFCFLRFPDNFRAAVEEIIRCGGDTDSTAAIVGALAGANLGPNSIPTSWTNRLMEWPHSTSWIRHLAHQSAAFTQNTPTSRPRSFPLAFATLLRNIFFATIVLLHGFRRLLPPY